MFVIPLSTIFEVNRVNTCVPLHAEKCTEGERLMRDSVPEPATIQAIMLHNEGPYICFRTFLPQCFQVFPDAPPQTLQYSLAFERFSPHKIEESGLHAI